MKTLAATFLALSIGVAATAAGDCIDLAENIAFCDYPESWSAPEVLEWDGGYSTYDFKNGVAIYVGAYDGTTRIIPEEEWLAPVRQTIRETTEKYNARTGENIELSDGEYQNYPQEQQGAIFGDLVVWTSKTFDLEERLNANSVVIETNTQQISLNQSADVFALAREGTNSSEPVYVKAPVNLLDFIRIGDVPILEIEADFGALPKE